MRLATWGSVRGCCGHAHHSVAAAERCIGEDDRGCKQDSAPEAYSDRTEFAEVPTRLRAGSPVACPAASTECYAR